MYRFHHIYSLCFPFLRLILHILCERESRFVILHSLTFKKKYVSLRLYRSSSTLPVVKPLLSILQYVFNGVIHKMLIEALESIFKRVLLYRRYVVNLDKCAKSLCSFIINCGEIFGLVKKFEIIYLKHLPYEILRKSHVRVT